MVAMSISGWEKNPSSDDLPSTIPSKVDAVSFFASYTQPFRVQSTFKTLSNALPHFVTQSP